MRGTWHLPQSDTSGPGGCGGATSIPQSGQVPVAVEETRVLNYITHLCGLHLDSFHLSVPERNWVEAQMPMQSSLAHFVKPVPPFWVSLPAPPPSQNPGPGVRKPRFKRLPPRCPMAPGPCLVVAWTAESGTSSASLDPHQACGCRHAPGPARPRPVHRPTVSHALPVVI